MVVGKSFFGYLSQGKKKAKKSFPLHFFPVFIILKGGRDNHIKKKG
jgi:hypothetical protein